jgi:hypothetical protein
LLEKFHGILTLGRRDAPSESLGQEQASRQGRCVRDHTGPLTPPPRPPGSPWAGEGPRDPYQPPG